MKTAARYAELLAKYKDEKVFCVPFNNTYIIHDKFTKWSPAKMKKDIFGGVLPYGKFILRADAEEDMSLQQIIPYVFITDTNGNFFISKRINGERRLLGKLSLGIGGHINPCDDTHSGVGAMVNNGMRRECKEETTIFSTRIKVSFEKYGTVRDLSSSTPDHIGLVYHAIVERGKEFLNIKEKNTLKGVWFTKEELVRNFEKFESWAQFIIADIVVP